MKSIIAWTCIVLGAIVALMVSAPPDLGAHVGQTLTMFDPETLSGLGVAFAIGSTAVSGPKKGLQPTTYLAGAAIVKYRAVKRGADQQTVIMGTANSINLGVSEDDQDTAGRPVRVAHRPGELVPAQVGAAVAIDAYLTSDANGKHVTATTGQNAHAIAREVATAVDQIISIELIQVRAAP